MLTNVITHVETLDPVASLTFDDGPHPTSTPRLLNVLEKYNIRATFFMIGESAIRFPDIVRMVANAGHVIGNHSLNHINLTTIRSRFQRVKQLWFGAKATNPYCKRIFRPPYGAQNRQIQIDALLFRYKIILWNASAQDWIPQKRDDIAQKIIDGVSPGSIFLLHDSLSSKDEGLEWDRGPMLDGLEMALDRLNRRIQFITVPELLLSGRPVCIWPHK